MMSEDDSHEGDAVATQTLGEPSNFDADATERVDLASPVEKDDESDEEESEPVMLARCMYGFDSTCDVELTIKVGDIVSVTRRDVGDGWWEGEVGGVFGLFPEKYVKLLGPADDPEVQKLVLEQTAPSSSSKGISAPPRPLSSSQAQSHATAASGRVSTKEMAFAIESGAKWRTTAEPITVTIKNSRKGSKFSGIKQFTLYEISSGLGGEIVSHRFKHFVWLHEQLTLLFPCISIPPIPDKQVQGRFDEGFVEQRRRALERFLNRSSSHPVIGHSPVFAHFLTTSDYKEWKSGKRQVESESINSPFLSQVSVPSDPPPDPETTLAKVAKFYAWIEKQLIQLSPTFEAVMDANAESANNMKKIGAIFKRFPIAETGPDGRGEYSAWWKEAQGSKLESLMIAIGELGKTFELANVIATDHVESDRLLFLETIKEYLGVLKTVAGMLKVHEAAWHELQVVGQKKDTSVSSDAFQAMHKKCNVVSYVVLAEFRHMHESLVAELQGYLQKYIQEQVEYHKSMASLWQNLLPTLNVTK